MHQKLPMTLQLTLIQLFTICAVLNGFVFSVLIFDKKENRFANRFLALTIICMCLTFTPYMLDPQIWHSYRWLAWLPFSLSYWIGPSFYFYTLTLTNPDWRFRKVHLWHFTPIILNYLHSVYHLVFPGNHTPWYWFHFISEIFESVAILSILIYMFYSFRLIRNYQKILLDNVSNTERLQLNWLKQIILVIMTSFIFILIFLAISSGASGMVFFHQWNQYRSVVLLLYALVLYWLSIFGFQQTQTLKLHRDLSTSPTSIDPRSQNVLAKLITAMEEQKLYRNPTLTLSDLSEVVQESNRTISSVINSQTQKNFFHFVNEFRVRDMQEKLDDPRNNNLKIISLAYDSGFNSKATFNRIFKSYTGMTPVAYKGKINPSNQQLRPKNLN